METDAIKEKYIRSEEALSKLRDDMSQLISTRIQDLQGTKEYLDTLVKEKEAVEEKAKEAMPVEDVQEEAKEETPVEKAKAE